MWCGSYENLLNGDCTIGGAGGEIIQQRAGCRQQTGFMGGPLQVDPAMNLEKSFAGINSRPASVARIDFPCRCEDFFLWVCNKQCCALSLDGSVGI